jgi:hypothetical protein
MTTADDGPAPGGPPTTDPEPPWGPQPPGEYPGWDQAKRIQILGGWIDYYRTIFTDEALRRSAERAGYTTAEFDEASRVADARAANRRALAPIRTRARNWAIVAYVATWLALTAIFGRDPPRTVLDFQELFPAGFAITLIAGLGISVFAIRILHPDAERRSQAFALLLVVPFAVLLSISGLCVAAWR